MRIGLTNCFTTLTQWLLIASFGLIGTGLVASSATVGQEGTLGELKQQWKAIEIKLGEKEAALKAEGADIDKLQEEYSTLLVDAEEMINKLESAAFAKLKTEPNNQESIRAIMGILLNDAQNNRDAKVLKAGEQLISRPVRFLTSSSSAKPRPSRTIFPESNSKPQKAISSSSFLKTKPPETVANFISLGESGWYSNKLFHRVIEDFMAQTGGFELTDGKQTGGKGPGYEIECECDNPDTRQHFTGSLSMAHRGKDTGGAQLFLTFKRTGFLDGKHTCFGRVIEGFRTLELVARTHASGANGQEVELPGVTKDKIISAEVLRKRKHRYRPNKVGVDEAAEDAAAEKGS